MRRAFLAASIIILISSGSWLALRSAWVQTPAEVQEKAESASAPVDEARSRELATVEAPEPVSEDPSQSPEAASDDAQEPPRASASTPCVAAARVFKPRAKS
jgi:cytoskeletal protein RodZ